jgi:hypothetical protein
MLIQQVEFVTARQMIGKYPKIDLSSINCRSYGRRVKSKAVKIEES